MRYVLICATNLIVAGKDYGSFGVLASRGLAHWRLRQIILQLLKGGQFILIGPGWKLKLVLTTSTNSLFEHVGNAEWIDYRKHDKVRPSQTTPETSSRTLQEQVPSMFLLYGHLVFKLLKWFAKEDAQSSTKKQIGHIFGSAEALAWQNKKKQPSPSRSQSALIISKVCSKEAKEAHIEIPT